MNKKDSKEKIMASATELFAIKGFNNTSKREITKHSQTNIASVNYYFGSKTKMATEIIKSIMNPLNQKRITGLEKYLRDMEKSNFSITMGNPMSLT